MLKPSITILFPFPLTSFSPIGVAGADEISPKVLQALGTEPIQVSPCLQPLVQHSSAAQGLDEDIRAQAEGEGVITEAPSAPPLPLSPPSVSSMQCL